MEPAVELSSLCDSSYFEPVAREERSGRLNDVNAVLSQRFEPHGYCTSTWIRTRGRNTSELVMAAKSTFFDLADFNGCTDIVNERYVETHLERLGKRM